MGIAGVFHGGVEIDRVGIVLGSALVEHRREIGTAAEPGFRSHHMARVHMHCRHMRVLQVGDQRDAGCPEPRIIGRAWDFLAEFGREFAEHGRHVHADLLEYAPLHDRHDATATGRPSMVGALPGRAHKPTSCTVYERRAIGQVVLDRLEGRADIVAQALKPCAGACLAGLDQSSVHDRTSTLHAAGAL